MDDRKNQNREPENGSGGGPKNRQTILIILICLLVSLMVMGLLNNALGGITSEDLDYSKFLDMVNNDEVQEVVLKSGTLTVTPKDQKSEGITYQVTMMGDEQELVDLLQEKGITYHKDPPDSTGTIIYTLLTVILPVVMLVAVMVWVMRSMNKGGGVMGVGKSRAKAYVQKETGVTFRDVAGQDEAKESLQEVVDFLHNPGKYTTIGAKLPKGALLVGPPGTGKTLLAKAVAGEAHVPFFSMSASEFVEMFVGVGASRVRDLFDKAKKNHPCIIFIDEIDAVGRQRGAGLGGGHDEREQTLNQLLVEMDGFGANEGVIMIAATNRPDILDPALMRPGRFDRQVMVGYPDVRGREDILRVHAKGKPLAPDVDLSTIAKSTAGFTGADLENLLNEAALLAARKDHKSITMEEIEEATIKVVVGTEKKSRVMTNKEKKLTAYHEAGHAIATYFCDSQDPVHQISIIPRGMAGGYTMHLPTEDKSYQSRNEMREELIVLLGGRVAEALVLDDISTGASNDIERATKIVRAMVTKYGMSDRLGPITYGADSSNPFLGKEMGHVSNYSEETAAEIDEEIKSIICDAYDKTKKVLSEHIDLLHRLAGVLFEREKLDADEFLDVMNGKLLPSAQTAAAGIIPAEAAAPETTELPTEAQTEPEANTNE